jgi:hypothetical protein
MLTDYKKAPDNAGQSDGWPTLQLDFSPIHHQRGCPILSPQLAKGGRHIACERFHSIYYPAKLRGPVPTQDLA